jgi:hypothetical protein
MAAPKELFHDDVCIRSVSKEDPRAFDSAN